MSFNSILSAIFVAFFAFGVFQVFTGDEVSSSFKEKLVSESKENPIVAALFVKSLDELNPAFTYDLPFTEKKVMFVNKFPYPSWGIVSIMIAVVGIGAWILGRAKLGKAKMLGPLFLLLVGSYFLAVLLLLAVFYVTAIALDLPSSEVTSLLDAFGSGAHSFMLPFLIASVFSIGSLLKVMVSKVKG